MKWFECCNWVNWVGDLKGVNGRDGLSCWMTSRWKWIRWKWMDRVNVRKRGSNSILATGKRNAEKKTVEWRSWRLQLAPSRGGHLSLSSSFSHINRFLLFPEEIQVEPETKRGWMDHQKVRRGFNPISLLPFRSQLVPTGPNGSQLVPERLSISTWISFIN